MGLKRWHVILLAVALIWLLTFSITQIAKSKDGLLPQDEIAIINIEGELSTLQQYPFGLQAHSTQAILENLKEAKESNNIKAVILVINSPGGTVIASKEIAEAVETLDKPIIAVIREIGTSGAYWVAASADKIIADELSITGSIGVTSSYLEFSGLMEKYGVSYEQLSVGKYKELGSPFKPLTEEERSLLDKKITTIHNIFLNRIQEKRELKDIERIKTGEFFLGIEAFDLGLIDQFGNLQTAIEEAKKLANIPDAKIRTLERKQDLFNLLSQFSSEASYNIGRGIGAELKQPSIKTSYKFSA